MHKMSATLLGLAGGLALIGSAAKASPTPATVKTVFVIAMENHDWIDGTSHQILGNPNAPFINSLVDGTAAISSQVAYANAYHNALATPDGHNPHVHPSEPNYIWAEAGGAFGIRNDNDPFDASGPTAQHTHRHLTFLLQEAGISWKSYQEDTDLVLNGNGRPVNIPAPRAGWTVPLVSQSGAYARGTNAWNRSNQYSYAAKHDPQVFFYDTDGGPNTTPSNPERLHYAPLQQLTADLANNQVGRYTWITPNEFNDMHTPLPGGYAPLDGGATLTGDPAQIRQGDDFLRQILPVITASQAYKDNGAIIIWWDESEASDSYASTIGEIVVSSLAHPNVDGKPYASYVNLSHSSDLRTMQEIFGVDAFWLGDAANMPDLSSLFATGAIPQK